MFAQKKQHLQHNPNYNNPLQQRCCTQRLFFNVRVLFVKPVPALCPQNRRLITCCFVCGGVLHRQSGQTWLNFRTASDFVWSRALCNLISYRFLTTSACQPRFQLCASASQPKMGGFKKKKKERKTTKPPRWISSLGNEVQLWSNDCDISVCYIIKEKTIFYCNVNTTYGALDLLYWQGESLTFLRHSAKWQCCPRKLKSWMNRRIISVLNELPQK